MGKDDTTSDSDIERFEYSPLSQTAKKILNYRIRKSTRDKYYIYWKQFKKVCKDNNKTPQKMEVEEILFSY